MAAGTLNERTRVGITLATFISVVVVAGGVVAGYFGTRDDILRETRRERNEALMGYPTRLELERALVLQNSQTRDGLEALRREVINLRIAVETQRVRERR